jgi:hypothetical protein
MLLRCRPNLSALPPTAGHAPQAEHPRSPSVNNGKAAFVWGWLRLVLGITQITFSVWSVVLIVRDGLQPKTGIVIGLGFLALALSRWIYRGRARPPGPQ